MSTLTEFQTLWKKTISMVSFECTRCMADNEKDFSKKINDYYRKNVLSGFWFSTTFPNEFNAWMVSLEESDPALHRKLKDYMWAHTELMPPSCTSTLYKIGTGITMATGVMAAFCKRGKLAIAALGASALGGWLSTQATLASDKDKAAVASCLVKMGKDMESIIAEHMQDNSLYLNE